MKVISAILIVFAIVLLPTKASAQDIHFSQFYASPLTLNPALTGKVNGNYRVAGIFRSQWGGIPNGSGPTFGTPSASFDMPFFVGKKKKDAVGVGVAFVNDYSNGKLYKLTRGILSVSYIKSLGSNGKHQLSLGFQGGIQQNKGGMFRFSDQFTDAVYQNGSSSVDASLNDQSKIIPDFNAGLFYNGALTQKLTYYAGFSMFHLFEPKEQFGTGNTSVLPRRYVVHTGLEWDISNKFTLYPGLIYMNQAKNQELNFGTNIGFHLKNTPDKRTTLYAGAWYRNKDAFIAMLGMEMYRIRVGLSYDVTTSTLKNPNTRGSFEISLIYVGRFLSIGDKNVFLFCPRF
jgi:type IX secretion system PorP/SprF family membrane protein